MARKRSGDKKTLDYLKDLSHSRDQLIEKIQKIKTEDI